MTGVHPEPDVCIVGAGVMGLSLAHELARRGRCVVSIDRSSPGREASAATAGTLAVQNKPVPSIPLTLYALRLWQTMARDLDFEVEYEVRGGLRVAHTEEDADRLVASVRTQTSAGAAIELVEPGRLRQIAPYLSDAIRLAAFSERDGMVNPFAVVRGLVRACRRAGVRFESGRRVERLSALPGGGYRIEAGELTLDAPVVVLAGGAWLEGLAALAGVSLPVVPRIQQVLITDAGPPLVAHVVTHVRGTLTLKQQAGSGKVLIGGGWTGTGDAARGERRLSRDSMAGNARIAIATVPELAHRRLLRAWTGLEGRSPDKLPILGELPGRPHLYAMGSAAGGLTLAPACARLLAQRLSGEPEDLSLAPFSPARFTEAVVHRA